MIIVFIVFATFVYGSLSQSGNCDYRQDVQPGQTYFIFSPNYSNFYQGANQCRWIARCPQGYNCRLNCSDIQIPYSPGCTMDRLLISRSGDPTLTSAESYCGTGTLVAKSTGQQISVGLMTVANTPGGRFFCSLTAEQSASATSCMCGYRKVNRIVGGNDSNLNEFPMMAALIDKRIQSLFCGAVIIYSHYLVTAAHCFDNMNYRDVSVVVGEHNLEDDYDSPVVQYLNVSDVLIHPLYNNNNNDYDIALILTDRKIQFSDRVGAACLPFKFLYDDFANKQVTALGWGTIVPGGPTSDILQKVQLNVVGQRQCKSAVPSLTARQICTYAPGRDACQYDSGGPLLYTDPTTGLLFHVGIISFGTFCASDVPGVNSRITTLLDWITANTPDAKYCRK